MPESSIPNDTAQHRPFAVRFFNETWALLDKPSRTLDEDARMIHLAHASRLHWEFAGSAQNWAVGEWQIARMYCVLGMKEAALYHARRCLKLAQDHNFTGFNLGSAHEGMARALRLSGDPEAETHLAAAKKILGALTEKEEAEVLAADLDSIPK